jgi:ATP phosphoribosyltransferase regulatory subunit
VEVQRLLAESLKLAGVPQPRLDIGHVAVFRSIAVHGGIATALEGELFEALQAKDLAALRGLTAKLDAKTRAALLLLPELYGGAEVLDRAARELPEYPEIAAAIADLRVLSRADVLPVSVDLADLRGYHYHSGVVFAAYCPGLPNAIALGGRYDEVGKAFGRARPATGFSIYMRELVRVLPPVAEAGGVLVPYSDDTALAAEVKRLRDAGEVVITDLPGHDSTRMQLGCDRRLVLKNGKWQMEKLQG